MKTKSITTGILLISLALGLSPFIIENQFTSQQTTSFNSSATVVNESGKNITVGLAAGEKFKFGDLSPGLNITKTINVSTDRQIFTGVQTEGNISESLIYEDHSVLENENIPITFNAGEPGYYEGKINVKIWLPENELAEKWLELKYSFYSLL